MKNPGLEAMSGWIFRSETWANKIIKKWIDFSSKKITGIKPLRVRISVSRYEQLVCRESEISKQGLW